MCFVTIIFNIKIIKSKWIVAINYVLAYDCSEAGLSERPRTTFLYPVCVVFTLTPILKYDRKLYNLHYHTL